MSSSSAIATLEGLQTSNFTSEVERVRAKDAALALVARLETPFETSMRVFWGGLGVFAALQVCQDVDLWGKWNSKGIDKPMAINDLASLTGVEPLLVERLLRHLSAAHLLEQTGDTTFKTTQFTRELGDGLLRSTVRHLDLNIPMMNRIPQFVKEGGYVSPADSNNTPLRQHLGEDLFVWLAKNPGVKENFSKLMNFTAGSLSPWTELIDPKALVDSRKEGRAVFVDIGGSQGHDIKQLKELYPNLPEGSLVLQDLPSVVSLPGAQALKPNVTPMGYDFFTPQPIKGARAYYIHRVLHDWSDTDTKRILKQITDAMEKGYSSLLIHEVKFPEMNPSIYATTMDMAMLASFSSLERTDSMWEKILGESGLKIVKFWRRPEMEEQIVEAVLA